MKGRLTARGARETSESGAARALKTKVANVFMHIVTEPN